jgi:hypothetical protein
MSIEAQRMEKQPECKRKDCHFYKERHKGCSHYSEFEFMLCVESGFKKYYIKKKQNG